MTRGNLDVAPADPRLQVFANIPFGPDRERREDAETVALCELEKRYPAGAGALAGGYLVSGLGGRRRLLCFGFPENCEPPGGEAVAVSAYVPRRVVLRRRSVVLRPGDGFLTRICFERGVPREIVTFSHGPSTGESVHGAAGRAFRGVPAGFERAPRFVLYGSLPAPSRASEPVEAASEKGARAVRERRQPSANPALRGKPARRRRRRFFRALAAFNLALAVILGVTAGAGNTNHPVPSDRQAAGEDIDVAVGASTASFVEPAVKPERRSQNAAFALVDLSRVLGAGLIGGTVQSVSGSATDAAIRLEEARIEGALLRLWGSGVPGARVVDALSGARDFSEVKLISQSLGGEGTEAAHSGGGFLVSARYVGPPPRGEGESKPLAAVLRSLLDEAGLVAGTMRLAKEGATGGAGYRVESVGGDRPVVAALVELSRLGGELEVRSLSLSRREAGLWELRFRVVSSVEEE